MINWKIRIKNRIFLGQILAAIALPVLSYAGLTVQDMTTWPAVGRVIIDALQNPYVLGLTVVSVLNAVYDPTTAGFSDSQQALSYNTPKKEKNK